MLDSDTPYLRNFWYLAVAGRDLKRGTTLARTLLDEPLLLGRTAAGQVFALHDVCPHRGVPLRYGDFDGREVACCYHGWKFAPDGRCTEIPSLVPGQKFNVERVKVRAYPCQEIQGNVWVFIGDEAQANGPDRPDLPEVLELPDIGDVAPQVAISRPFPCNADHAAFGLMDPTHAAFVHTSWWWKKKARTLRQKHKDFEPAPLGWRMKRHKLPPENRVYRLLGQDVTTEITYALPGIRVEHIKGDKDVAVGLTAITPVTESETVVHQSLYCTLGWIAPLRPLGRLLAGIFLDQDRDMVIRQQEGLAHDPNLMLIDDADTQAKWYHRLKTEWLKAEAEGRAFENPIQAKSLSWRS